jgi:hypothetical protein
MNVRRVRREGYKGSRPPYDIGLVFQGQPWQAGRQAIA